MDKPRGILTGLIVIAARLGVVLLLQGCSHPDGRDIPEHYEIPYIAGESQLVLSPVPPDSIGEWYINDHCFITDKSGTLHFFGINNPFPTNRETYLRGRGFYDLHMYIGHARTNNPFTGWERSPWALDDSKGSGYVGAPFVVWLEDRGMYMMIFQSLHSGHRTLELAYSADLEHWERTGQPVLDYLPEGSRDPCVIQDDDGSFLLYLATPTPAGSSITVTRTRDFRQFDTTHTCLTIKDAIWYSGAESPFVVHRHGLYYLFVTYAHRHYFETLVYVSRQPDHFSRVITTLYAHAPEILQWHGKEYITSCGPEGRGPLDKHGLYMAELKWTE